MRVVLRSKIHRAYVTDSNPDYIGSIIIDQALMKKVDLWEFEKVLICDVTNGNRWDTCYPVNSTQVRFLCKARGLSCAIKGTA